IIVYLTKISNNLNMIDPLTSSIQNAMHYLASSSERLAFVYFVDLNEFNTNDVECFHKERLDIWTSRFEIISSLELDCKKVDGIYYQIEKNEEGQLKVWQIEKSVFDKIDITSLYLE